MKSKNTFVYVAALAMALMVTKLAAQEMDGTELGNGIVSGSAQVIEEGSAEEVAGESAEGATQISTEGGHDAMSPAPLSTERPSNGGGISNSITETLKNPFKCQQGNRDVRFGGERMFQILPLVKKFQVAVKEKDAAAIKATGESLRATLDWALGEPNLPPFWKNQLAALATLATEVQSGTDEAKQLTDASELYKKALLATFGEKPRSARKLPYGNALKGLFQMKR